MLQALFLNEGDSSGTRGQGRVEMIMRRYVAEADGVDAHFARLLPPRGIKLRAASGLIAPLWRRDLDFQASRWHAIQALRVRAMLDHALRVQIPNVIHVHPHTAGLALWGQRKLPPFVLSVDAEIWDWRQMEIWQPVRPWSKTAMTTSLLAQRRALERAATVVAWTDWARDGLARAAPRARIAVQHPGLDLDRFRPAEPTPRRRPRILFVGGRFARKGGNDLIRALQPILAEGAAELDIVSPDEIPSAPGITVHRLGAGDPELLHLFQQADIFCLPSHGDAAPWVVLEAMACGLPVVGSCVGAVPEFLDDGRAGVLVNAGDVRALRRELAGLISDGPRREQLGAAARRRCELRYDARPNTASLLGVMRAVAS